MTACQQCTTEVRTARFNFPVSYRSLPRRLLDRLVAPSLRLHRYRNLSARMLQDSLDKMDSRQCK
ncbi:MAG: hypothetical protein QNJ11_18320 [Woeseiaceae bacterium]|nr:hypothetical protein [Woeseiaceae bacterium]